MTRQTTLACAVAFLAGCAAPDNDRLTMNNMETFGERGGTAEVLAEYAPLTGVARLDWSRTRYVVPVDATVHGPTYAPTIEWTDTIARERGAFPTLESSLDMSASSRWEQRAEACAAPFVGFAQGFLVIPLFFIDRQTNADESPSMAYQRAPTNAILPPAINEAAPPGESGVESGDGG